MKNIDYLWTMMNTTEFQTKILQLALEKLGEKNGKKLLAELLNQSQDAIYKKLRGETTLQLQEILIISERLKISLDSLLDQNKNQVLFDCTEVMIVKDSYLAYLNNIVRQLEFASQLPEKYVYYTSNEISLFQYFQYPVLAAFKLYIWARTNWGISDLSSLHEEIENIKNDSKVSFSLQKINALYNLFPSTEIWSINILDNTLNQLRWFIDSGELNDPVLINEIIHSLHNLLKQNKINMAISSKNNRLDSQTSIPWKVYYNEMTHTNNTILVTHAAGMITFVTHDNPNFMITTSTEFGTSTKQWMEKLIQKSENICGESEKIRNKYFSILQQKVKQFEQEIKKS